MNAYHTKSSRYRPDIDGLRAIAILSVIFFHLNPRLLPGGYLGVDVFFVISGYLITGLIARALEKKEFRLTDFYIRRIRRIIPALYALLIVITTLSLLILLPGDFKDFGRSLLSQSVFSSNLYFYLKSDYFDTPSLLKPILHTWSLSTEEQFYLIYPVFFVLLTKVLKQRTKYALFLLFLLSLATGQYIHSRDESAAFYLLPARMWELLLGAILIYLPELSKILSIRNEALVAWLGLFLIVFSVLFFSNDTQTWAPAALLPALGTAFIICCTTPTSASRFLSGKMFNYTGKISYSLYLWHWPLIVFFLYTTGSRINLLAALGLLCLSYVLASQSYKYIEVPVRRNAWFTKNSYLITGLFAGMIFFSGSGYYISKKEGFPERFSAEVQNLLHRAKREAPCMPRLFYAKSQFKFLNPCKPVTKAKPGILVWGDSHAGMLQPVLRKLAGEYQQDVGFYICPSALNVFIANWDKSYQESPCYLSNKHIIQYIRQNNIKSILFASAWSGYTEGRELKMEGAGQKDKLYADSQSTEYSTNDAKRVFKIRITSTVELLSSLNVDIWIMKQVPQHQFWAPNEIAKRIIYKQDTTHIGRPLKEHFQRQSFVNSVFESLSGKKNVHILDPTPYFIIDNNFLTVYKDRKPLYFDYNHLSPDGALLLKPMLEPMFKKTIDHYSH